MNVKFFILKKKKKKKKKNDWYMCFIGQSNLKCILDTFIFQGYH